MNSVLRVFRKKNLGVVLGLLIGLLAPVVVVVLLTGMVILQTSRSSNLPSSATTGAAPLFQPTSHTLTPTTVVALVNTATTAIEGVAPQPTALGQPLPGSTPTWTPAAATFTSVPPTATLTVTTGPRSTEAATSAPSATPTPSTPVPTTTAITTPPATTTLTPTQVAASWIAQNLSILLDPDDASSTLILGELLNNSEAGQEIESIEGTYSTDQGVFPLLPAAIVNWPADSAPPAGSVPFEIYLPQVTGVRAVELSVVSDSGSDARPVQVLQIEELTQTTTGSTQCFSGQVRPGGNLVTDYVTVTATLYGSQGKVVGLNYVSLAPPFYIVGDRLTLFRRLCVTPVGAEVTRVEVRAWGR